MTLIEIKVEYYSGCKIFIFGDVVASLSYEFKQTLLDVSGWPLAQSCRYDAGYRERIMRKLLVAINVLLVFTILGVAFFWNPEPEAVPLPGTHAAKLGGDVADTRTLSTMIPATPDGTTAGQISVLNAYVRLAPPGAKVTGAFMTLRNAGDREARLLSAVAAAASVTELHSHSNDDGVMRMRQVKEIIVPAKGEVHLKPGSFHVMLIDMKTPLKEGDQVAISLGFADGSSKRAEVPVIRPTTVIAPQD